MSTTNIHNPANLMRAFHTSNKAAFSDGSVPTIREFIRESTLDRILIHVLELSPVSIEAVHTLAHRYEQFIRSPDSSNTQDHFMLAIDAALKDLPPPDILQVRGYRFSFAQPGYCFVSSRRLRTFFPNINECLCDATVSRTIIQKYSEAVRRVQANGPIDRLCFIDKAFGPLGAVELRTPLCEKLKLPSMIYRSYSWRTSNQPVSAGEIKSGEKLCVLYDAGITGGLLSDFADYATYLGARTTAAVVFFDFDEGASETLADKGITYYPIIEKHTVLADIARSYERKYNREFFEYCEPQHCLPVREQRTVRGLERKFTQLAETWRQESRLASDPQDIQSHEAFAELVQLGKKAIPFVFQAYEHEPARWDLLLSKLTRQNPVPRQYAGDVYATRHYWLSWGRKHKYVLYGPEES
jgi:orotate phosphoribosyltransferase